jgi:hypothetical protein
MKGKKPDEWNKEVIRPEEKIDAIGSLCLFQKVLLRVTRLQRSLSCRVSVESSPTKTRDIKVLPSYSSVCRWLIYNPNSTNLSDRVCADQFPLVKTS